MPGQNTFYCFYAACSNVALFAITTSYERLRESSAGNLEGGAAAAGYRSLFAGQSLLTLFIILVNSVQGLVASFFYKFAGEVPCLFYSQTDYMKSRACVCTYVFFHFF